MPTSPQRLRGSREVPFARTLTSRQRQIVELIARGQTDAQIAHALCITPRTVRSHLERAFAGCNVRSRAALVAAWLRTAEHPVRAP
jgi:DNA-binding NarL/FixJ family response regulator